MIDDKFDLTNIETIKEKRDNTILDVLVVDFRYGDDYDSKNDYHFKLDIEAYIFEESFTFNCTLEKIDKVTGAYKYCESEEEEVILDVMEEFLNDYIDEDVRKRYKSW